MTLPQILRSGDPTLSERLVRLASRSMPAILVDDRFDEAWEHQLDQSNEQFVAAGLLEDDGEFVAYLGGFIEGGVLHLDLLVDLRHPDPRAATIQLLTLLAPRVQQQHVREQVESEDSVREDVKQKDNVLEVFVWAKPSFDWQDGLVGLQAESGPQLQPHRALHQMRAPMADLLTDRDPLPTRSFAPGVDDEALRVLNNRAFAQHPDQGDQSAHRFQVGLAQAWVRPAGIRIYEVEQQLVGFCWTRIHQEPALGEIYVIGIDPAFHGQGLGGPMTAAGLHWLDQKGLQTAMLYVEANNEPALATYERLGFRTVRTDQSWRWLMPQ